MKHFLLVLLILITISLAGFSQDTMMMSESSGSDEGISGMMSDESGEDEWGSMMMSDDIYENYGSKIPFTGLDMAETLAEKRTVVLFFYASWCPSCRIADKNIDENIAKLKNITILVVDYDREKALKKKFGVTYQHTFVQIDENGRKVAIWNGGNADTILKNVKDVMVKDTKEE